MKGLKSFKAWLVVDAEGTYVPTLHLTKREAQTEIADQHFIRGANWRVVRVRVTPDSGGARRDN